jgi:hypothetical protein
MSLDLTFKQACILIKKEQPDLIEAMDKILGLALLCSPVFTGSIALLPLITAKNELTKLTKSTFETFTKRKSESYFERQTRMKLAYALISYTSFFEALDHLLPDIWRSRLKLLNSEKIFILKEAQDKVDKTVAPVGGGAVEPIDKTLASSVMIQFPHPVDSLERQKARLLPLYKEMAGGFKEFVQRLSAWEELDEKGKQVVAQAIDKVPDIAAEFFDAQYIELSRKYDEFAIWANLQEHKKSAALVETLSTFFQEYAHSVQSSSKSIDIGLSNLRDLVSKIPETLKIKQAEDIVEGLRKHYVARINDPIIDDRSVFDGERPRLVFPRVCDAFVPQSFHAIRIGNKRVSLEDPETWRSQPRRDDLGTFLLSYLSSPHSTDSPLIILGHPGSGKSLLTTVLSARLLSKHFVAIRVPLREVNSEAGVTAQIEEHIGRVTSIKLDSWAKCSGTFTNNPPIVILDGYDELLQASGKVFAGYLREVQNFQKNEAEQGRPVRVVVTSRVTLIDKAIVPQGSTIVRLLEFNTYQRNCWISIWNSANVHYFHTAEVQPFSLPDDKEPGADKLLQLAEQPLLLLMLALYDSVENKLRSGGVPDRTVLYDSLLRRFIYREREKSDQFKNLEQPNQDLEVDKDMQRLGAVAIGMYNRRTLHILSEQLSGDLKFFNLERVVSLTGEGGRQLTQADLLLGSFFFVHKSKAVHETEVGDHQAEVAFEFLHNTFGEFLTADFIIRQTMAEIGELIELSVRPALRVQRERKLSHVDGLSRSWFACLVYTALFTRPVVLEMIRECIGHVLNAKEVTKDSFIGELDAIVQSQISRVLSRREMPSIMQKDEAQEGYRAPFGSHPLLGHLAVYSINMIIIRAVVGDGAFQFDESLYFTHEESARPWDQLTHLWRSWFSIDSINGITAVLLSERSSDGVRVSPRIKMSVVESRSRLETVYNVNRALGDNIGSGIIGLVLAGGSSGVDLTEVERLLTVENIDLSGQICQKKLMEYWNARRRPDHEEFSHVAARALELAARSEQLDQLASSILLVGRIVERFSLYRPLKDNEQRLGARGPTLTRALIEIASSSLIAALALHHMDAARNLIELVQAIHGQQMSRRIREEIFHQVFRRGDFMEFAERGPDATLRVMELLRELGGLRWMDKDTDHVLSQLLERINIPKWVSRRPTEVAKLAQLLRESGKFNWAERINSDLFNYLFRDREFFERAERRPEQAMELLQRVNRLRSQPWPDSFGEELFDRLFARVRFEEWFEKRPEDVIVLLELGREFGASRFRRDIDDELFDRLFRRRHHHPMEWAEGNPDAAIGLVELALEYGATGWADRFAGELFELPFIVELLSTAVYRKIDVFGKAVRVARLLADMPAGETVRAQVALAAFDRGDNREALSQLPIKLLSDLKWLADRAGTGGSLMRYLGLDELPHWLRAKGRD